MAVDKVAPDDNVKVPEPVTVPAAPIVVKKFETNVPAIVAQPAALGNVKVPTVALPTVHVTPTGTFKIVVTVKLLKVVDWVKVVPLVVLKVTVELAGKIVGKFVPVDWPAPPFKV